MAGVTPEIRTKFTLQGIREGAAGMRRFGVDAKGSLDKVKLAGAKALEPFKKDIDQAKRSLHGLQLAAVSVGTVGFGGMLKGARLAFSGIKIGAASAAASVAGITAAAVKSSKDSAAEMEKLAKDARRLGINISDLSVLNFAAEHEGVDPDAVTKGIAKIGSEFLKVRQEIAGANAEFAKLQARARGDATLAVLQGDFAGLRGAADGIASARSGSLDAIRQRAAFLQDQISQLDVIGGPRLDAHQQIARQVALFSKRRELEDLQKAEADLKKSMGPGAEAMFGLESYGLDVDKAAKGGVEGFVALGDAIKQVEDPAERLRYSMLLFGENAGPKMLNLLMSGRQGIDAYRKELERLGGVVTEQDGQLAEAYGESATNLKRSISGIKLAVSRELLPLLTETNKQATDFLVRHRQTIAGIMKTTFVAVRNLAADALDAFNGRRSGFRSEWLNSLMDGLRKAKEWVRDFRDEVQAAFDGRGSRHEWLNRIAGAFKTARDFAKDLFALLKGGDAEQFPWLNRLRDGVVEFAESFKKAFDAFMQMLQTIRDSFIRPIADFLGTDPLTMALFVGFARFTGILGAATTAVGLLGKSLQWLFGLKGAAELASSIGGIATAAGAAGGVGAAGGRAGRLAAGLATAGRAAGVLGAAAVGGWMAGDWLQQKATDWSGLTDKRNEAFDATARLAKLQGDLSFARRYNTVWDTDRRKTYWESVRPDIDYGRGKRTAAFDRAFAGIDANAYGPGGFGRAEAFHEINVTVNGVRSTVRATPDNARAFRDGMVRLNRLEGGY